jgi:hypothetical protein
MNRHIKNVEDLSIRDLESFPVWEFLNMDDQFGEMAVRPVKKIPTESLGGRLVGTRVRLSNGSDLWAIISNVDADDPRSTRHFLTISLFHEGKLFHLARYHDFWALDHGPKALAAFLRLPVRDVFPISYDLSRFALGDPTALVGSIPEKPEERLSRDEINALAISKSTPTNYDR